MSENPLVPANNVIDLSDVKATANHNNKEHNIPAWLTPPEAVSAQMLQCRSLKAQAGTD